MKNLFLTFFAAVLLLSCSAVNSITSKVGSNQPSIVGTKWTLAENVKGKVPTLVVENGKVSGNAGCNNYFGNAYLDTTVGNFKVDNMGATKMACDNLDVEGKFLKMLNEANKYVVDGNTLSLYKDNLLLLKFNKLP